MNPVKKSFWVILGGGTLFFLSACGKTEPSLPDTTSQTWNDWTVRVESRPSPPRDGMNEFLVRVTGAHDRPGSHCLVDIRTAQSDPWKQAIQDGRVGVYRRAALVEPGERRTVQVRLNCADEAQNSVLFFPLHVPN
ncbi:MAG: hypothetical protein GJU67_04045 [Ferrovum sp.]|nr:hypothetical protein [Ferrovum sp.]